MELEVIPFKDHVLFETVDGITVPVDLLKQAHRRADEARKTHFIGVIDEKRSDFQEPPSDMLGLAQMVGMAQIATAIESRYIITGYVISDDREAVLAKGCGRLVWVTPSHNATTDEARRNIEIRGEALRHTPAPWTIHTSSHPEPMAVGEGENVFDSSDYCIGNGEKLIAEFWMRKHRTDVAKLGYPYVETQEELLANTNLACAAPEMLSTLREVLGWFDRKSLGLNSLAVQVREVIKKAEGRA